jgi:hypothetical protein
MCGPSCKVPIFSVPQRNKRSAWGLLRVAERWCSTRYKRETVKNLVLKHPLILTSKVRGSAKR